MFRARLVQLNSDLLRKAILTLLALTIATTLIALLSGATNQTPQLTPKFPVHGAKKVPLENVTLSWNVSGGSKKYFYVLRFGKSPEPPLFVFDLTTTSYKIPERLEPETTYYWQVLILDEKKRLVLEGPIWEFVTDKEKPKEEKDGTLLWKFILDRGANNTPALGPDGTLYVTQGNILYAIQTIGEKNTNRLLKWFYPVRPNEPSDLSAPVVSKDGSILFVTSKTGYVFAFSRSGTLLWSVKLGDGIHASPVVDDSTGRVIVATSDGKICSVDFNGRVSWRSEYSGTFRVSPVVGRDKLVYALDVSGVIRCLENRSGNQRFTILLEGMLEAEYNQGLAVGSDGTIYVSTVAGRLFSIKGSEVRTLFTVPGISFTAPVVGPGDVIYVGGSDGFVYAVSKEGRLTWKFKTTGPIVAAPVVGKDRTIYVGSTDSLVYAIGANGVPKWVYKTQGAILTSPTVSPRKELFVVSSDGNLYALKCSSEGLAASAWPKVGGNERNSGVFDPSFLEVPLFINAYEQEDEED